jgi:hypothetical protein
MSQEEQQAPANQQMTGMAWEDPARSFVARLLGTLGNALKPVRGAPALCGIRLLPAGHFALLTALPFMLMWGVIPFTNTLLFEPSFRVQFRAAEDIPMWLDVARSMAIGLGMSLLAQLSWALPFASLLRAFSAAPVPPALVSATAWRFVLYRAWLVPTGACLLLLAQWATPEPASKPLLLFCVVAFRFAPQVLVLLGAQATALTFGASALGSLAVAIVPMIMQEVVGLTVGHYAADFLPEPPPGTPGSTP